MTSPAPKDIYVVSTDGDVLLFDSPQALAEHYPRDRGVAAKVKSGVTHESPMWLTMNYGNMIQISLKRVVVARAKSR